MLVCARDTCNVLSSIRQCPELPALGLHVRHLQLPAVYGMLRGQCSCCPHADCPMCLAQVSESEIRIAQRAEREQEKIKKTMKARMDFLDFID